MSGLSNSGNDSCSFEELLQIRTRSRELKKEKDMLRESQSQSFKLIRRLELHVKTLSEDCTNDKKRIDELEGELRNCFKEIEYLQEKLNDRNMEVNCLNEHIHKLELKLMDMENLEDEVGRLRDELNDCHSDHFTLLQKFEGKENELQSSILCTEKLEESISSTVLEYQCEIESMKLDLMTLEQSHFETKKFHEETAQENAKLNKLIQYFELQTKDADIRIRCVDNENKDLRGKLKASEMNVKVFREKVEQQFQEWLESNNAELMSCDVDKNISICGDILGPLLSRVVAFRESDANVNDNMEKLSHQIHEYELLVKQLKEELRDEKLKAKEEAEDLAQEMAELRYQITELLEEESKRRACVEQLSLHRIAELEAQIEREQRKSFAEDQSKSRNALSNIIKLKTGSPEM